MRRPFAILLALGLLGAVEGCHHTHGVCDCDPGPIGHDGPPPLLAPIPQPPRPEAIPAMPKPTETVPAPTATPTPK